MFDQMRFRRSPLFEELRARIKLESKRDDIVTWSRGCSSTLRTTALRSPSAAGRKTLVLDDVVFYMVRVPAAIAAKRSGSISTTAASSEAVTQIPPDRVIDDR